MIKLKEAGIWFEVTMKMLKEKTSRMSEASVGITNRLFRASLDKLVFSYLMMIRSQLRHVRPAMRLEHCRRKPRANRIIKVPHRSVQS